METIYDVIFKLNTAGAELTGSHKFGRETQNSDWDFFISESAFRTFNVGRYPLDFTVESSTTYQDCNTVKVYKHRTFPVHVQICKDMDAKRRAQDFLLSMPRISYIALVNHHTKSSMAKLCDWAFERTAV